MASFQKDDIVRAINQNRFLFKCDTGTGKSYMLAGVISHLRYYGEINKVIILTSSVGTKNLNKELEGFITGYDASRTLVIHSVSALKDRLVFTDDYDIIICGYDTFRRINDAYYKDSHKGKLVKYKSSPLPLKEWFGDKKGIICADECHLIGSPSARKFKVLEMNLPFFEYRYAFSATPTDSEEKIWPLLKFLDKKLVNGLNYTDWLGTFCEMGNRFSAYAPNLDTWNRGKWVQLQDTLYTQYGTVRKKSILGLPPAIDVAPLYVDMSDHQREVYESWSNVTLEAIKIKKEQNKSSLIKELNNSFQVLQMAVDNPEIILTSEVMKSVYQYGIDTKIVDRFVKAVKNFNYLRDFSKLDALDDIIEYECTEMGNKIIVFYYHPKTMESLKKKYTDAFVLSTDVPPESRLDLIEDFKKSDSKILIASIMVANTSFTLNECKAAVFYEKYWSGLIYEQARGRIHRIGQDQEVRFYNIIYNNTVDYLQLLALDRKMNVMEGLLRKNTLTKDEWKLIFGGNSADQEVFVKSLF